MPLALSVQNIVCKSIVEYFSLLSENFRTPNLAKRTKTLPFPDDNSNKPFEKRVFCYVFEHAIGFRHVATW